MPPTPLAAAAAERTPATRTSSVNEGVEALTQMAWLKITHSTQQRRHSSTGYTPIGWRGDVTLPGARSGEGVPSPCRRGERESLSGRPPRWSGSNWIFDKLNYLGKSSISSLLLIYLFAVLNYFKCMYNSIGICILALLT
jgi:hypothetical protein